MNNPTRQEVSLRAMRVVLLIALPIAIVWAVIYEICKAFGSTGRHIAFEWSEFRRSWRRGWKDPWQS